MEPIKNKRSQMTLDRFFKKRKVILNSINPLEIGELITHVASFCSELEVFSRVCKIWNRVAKCIAKDIVKKLSTDIKDEKYAKKIVLIRRKLNIIQKIDIDKKLFRIFQPTSKQKHYSVLENLSSKR
jgi:hypothetical protein